LATDQPSPKTEGDKRGGSAGSDAVNADAAALQQEEAEKYDIYDLSPSLQSNQGDDVRHISPADYDLSLAYVDFETLSRYDIKTAGTHLYVADPTTEILILTWFFAGEYHEWTPDTLWSAEGTALTALAANDAITFVAHGSFDRLIWQEIMVKQFGYPPIALHRWRDTTATCAYHRLPLKLESALSALKLPIAKDKEGKRLVVGLSRQYRKSGVRPEVTPEKRARIAKYNRTDVEGLIALDQMLGPLPDQERLVWQRDQTTNDDGFQIDLELVHAMQRLRAEALEKAKEEFDQIVNAGVDPARRVSPTQVKKLRQWLLEQGEALENLRKGTLAEAIKGAAPDLRRVMEVRLEFAASSLKKLDAMVAGADASGVARGTLVYHGAATGRWTGRRLQPQNLPRPLIKIKPDQVEELVGEIKRGDVEALLRRLPDGHTLTDLLVSSLRYIVTARPGMTLAVGDFSMIEACVVLALAKQWDKVELILKGLDPYRDMGGDIFKLPPEAREAFLAVPKEALSAEQETWRSAGKVGVLSGGFGISAQGLHRKYPWLSLEECEAIVAAYRTTWAPLVPDMWWNLRNMAHAAVREPGKTSLAKCGVEYYFDAQTKRPMLICRLLNDKEIFYPESEIKPDQYGHPAIYFSAVKGQVYRRQCAWHGLLTENVVSALAREILVAAIQRLHEAGHRVILSVHDEIVIEGVGLTKEGMEELMSAAPQWVIDIGIPIAVEAWVGNRYRK
jgi:DNA polymerase